MRSVDLALFADELAARAATLAAQLEHARGASGRRASSGRRGGRSTRPRSPASNRSASCAGPTAGVRAEIRELAASLSVVEELQAWVERRLFEAGDEAA